MHDTAAISSRLNCWRRAGRPPDALRDELAPRRVAVTSPLMGWMFTDLAGFIPDDQKVDPAGVARTALDGVAAGVPEVLADATTQRVKSSLSA